MSADARHYRTEWQTDIIPLYLGCKFRFQESISLYLTYLLTYSMEQSPSWEANRFSARQDIPRILFRPQVH